MYNISDIREVHLEISTRCNAACPGCPRNFCGVDIIEGYPIHDMSLSEAQTVFSPEFLQQLTTLIINGNLGDFVTAKDGLEIVRYFRNQNPNLTIKISTNASGKSTVWAELAKLNVQVLFCIDGLESTHEKYRRQTNWNTILNNAKSFISNGGDATWKMILFDHNRGEVEQCRALSQDLGFNHFQLIDQQRDAFPVFDQKKNFLYNIGQHTQPNDFAESFKLYQDSTTNNYLEPIDVQSVDCKVKKSKSIYVAATGEIYPCCWLGFYPRTMWSPGHTQIASLLPENNNANQVGLELAMNWFNQVETSLRLQPLHQCKATCGIKNCNQ